MNVSRVLFKKKNSFISGVASTALEMELKVRDLDLRQNSEMTFTLSENPHGYFQIKNVAPEKDGSVKVSVAVTVKLF